MTRCAISADVGRALVLGLVIVASAFPGVTAAGQVAGGGTAAHPRPEPSSPQTKPVEAKPPAGAPAGPPRSAALDEVYAAVSRAEQRMAAVTNGRPAPPRAPAPTRVTLEWRASLQWPTDVLAASPADRDPSPRIRLVWR